MEANREKQSKETFIDSILGHYGLGSLVVADGPYADEDSRNHAKDASKEEKNGDDNFDRCHS